MKLSENWLRSWVNPDINTQTLTDKLSLAGLEVAGFEPVSSKCLSGIVVGQILSISPHPDAEKLSLTEVDVGDEKLEIVTNLQGLSVGQFMAVAKPGAKIDDLTIEPRALRGVTSFGMFAGNDTLGIESDNDLPVFPETVQAGDSVVDVLSLNDHIIEIELTANRGDCLSIEGVAREVATITDTPLEKPFKEVSLENFESLEKDIQIEMKSACLRYHAASMKGCNLASKTPHWMIEALTRSGIQVIHPVVDILNYVMLEMGQPMHAFDLSKLQGGIFVREAKAGEQLTLLNQETVELQEGTMLIADEATPLALAGIMGGLESSVTAQTTDILIECAHFTPEWMMGKARQYGLHTDSSHRYERGVDPNLIPKALARAVELIERITGAQLHGVGCRDVHEKFPKKPLSLRLAKLEKWLGVSLEMDAVCTTLSHLGFSPKGRKDVVQVKVPTFRFDIEGEVDLIEEVARIYGYDHIPSQLKGIEPDVRASQKSHHEHFRVLKHQLAAKGLTEVVTYSFQDGKLLSQLGFDDLLCRLSNPITSELDTMRPSILPGLIKIYQYWQAHGEISARLFELGTVFLESGQVEENRLAALFAGERQGRAWHSEGVHDFDFYDAKGFLEELLKQKVTFEPVQHHLLHPGQAAQIMLHGKSVGLLGALHPKLVRALKLKKTPFLLEVDSSCLLSHEKVRYKSFSKLPSVKRDLAFWVNKNLPYQAITNVLSELNLKYLQSCQLFDVFAANEAGDDKKSLAIALIFQSDTYTLKDRDVDEEVDAIISALRDQHGVSLRE